MTGKQCFRSFLRFSSCRAFFVPVFILSGQVLPHRRRHRRRRSKEIAIRKVNGSEATGILELLVKDVLYVAVVAVLIGVVAAWYVNGMWMDLFAEHVPLSWAAYLLIAIANLAVIVACVLWKSWKIANENPVNSIKSE